MKQPEKISQTIIIVGVVTLLILAVPFIAMQFTSQVDWSLPDFIIMGALIFGAGISYKLITRSVGHLAYRMGAGLAIGTGLLMIWANLAVGLIGSGPNAANLMYMGVLVVGLIGAFICSFNAAGMERTMYAMVLTLFVAAAIAFLVNMDEYPGSSATDILAVSGFFAMLFFVAGLFFRYASKETVPVNDK